MTTKSKVPRLRFPEFKGEWEEKKLGELFSIFKSGNGITSSDIRDEDLYPVYGGNGLRGYTNTYTHEGFFLLIGRQGALCGNINRSYGKAFISEHAIACLANEYSDTEWLAQRLDYFNLNKLSESSAQPGLSVEKLLRLKLIIPQLKEQTKIADFLSSIDERIQLLKQQKSQLEQYKKGVMQQIFSQQLRFKDENGEDYPDWKEKRLGEISERPMYGLNTASTDYDGINGYIRITDIDERSNRFNPLGITSPKDYSNEYLLKKGDLLFARTGASTGKSYLYKESDGRLFFAGFLIKFHIVNSNPQFIFYQTLLDSYNKWVAAMSMRSGQPGINAEEYSSLMVHIPSIAEQTKIANFLSAIDNKITLCNEQIKKNEEYKKGLLQQMFV